MSNRFLALSTQDRKLAFDNAALTPLRRWWPVCFCPCLATGNVKWWRTPMHRYF